MSTTTTTELKPLAVAAPSARVRAAHAVAAAAPGMCHASAGFHRTTYGRIERTVFGSWNPSRRLVGFVT